MGVWVGNVDINNERDEENGDQLREIRENV